MMQSGHRLITFPPSPLYSDTAYFEDFSSEWASPDWLGDDLTVSQATGTNTSWYLCPLNNDMVTLPLSGLDSGDGNATPNFQGQHSFVTVSYDLFIICGWTGNNDQTDAHTFAFDSSCSEDDGINRLTTTFSNQPELFQTYPYDTVINGYFSQPGGKGANQINTLGFTGALVGFDDAVYSFAGGSNQSFTFDHSVDDLNLAFSVSNLNFDSAWGITNLKVTTGGVFTWRAAPEVGDGLDGGWDIGDHWVNPDPDLHLSPGEDDAAEFTAAGDYNVSIHEDTRVGFLRFKANETSASTVRFNTIGHTLTQTAGNDGNPSLAVADGSGQNAGLFVFNSNNDGDSDFNGVINAETLGVARSGDAHGTLTLDGYLDPAKPGTDNNDLGNVILNVQRGVDIGAADEGNAGILNIQYGAILNGGVGCGSASDNPGDDNTTSVYAYVNGTVNVREQGVWNQTGAIWTGVNAPASLSVTKGGKVNIFTPAFAGETPATSGTLIISGFSGSNGAVEVWDADSQLNAGQILVGTGQGRGILFIDHSGTVTTATASIGSGAVGPGGFYGTSLVNITHQGLLTVTTPAGDGQFNIGDDIHGKMTLGYVGGNDGSQFSTGQATADYAVIGKAAGIYGYVDVTYAQTAELHSLFTVNKTLTVGAQGNGTLGMSGGGVTVLLGLDAANGPVAIAGDQADSHGLITMFGGSGTDTWGQGSTFDASTGGVVLGNAGFGRLEIYNGGQTFAKTIVMAQQADSIAELVLDGDGADNNHTTLLKVSDPEAGLAVGQAGASAATSVLGGALLDTFRATVGGQGGNEGPGTVTVQDLRDPATVLHHELGSLWLVHGRADGGSSIGGRL
jgi:T5SS/PEP-CTERM-associated repeat protein